jgi:hypothetical protein
MDCLVLSLVHSVQRSSCNWALWLLTFHLTTRSSKLVKYVFFFFTRQQLCHSTVILALADQPLPKQSRATQHCAPQTVLQIKLSIQPCPYSGRWVHRLTPILLREMGSLFHPNPHSGCWAQSFTLPMLWEVSFSFCPSPTRWRWIMFSIYGSSVLLGGHAICPLAVLDCMVPRRAGDLHLLEFQIYSARVGAGRWAAGKLCSGDIGPVCCRM